MKVSLKTLQESTTRSDSRRKSACTQFSWAKAAVDATMNKIAALHFNAADFTEDRFETLCRTLPPAMSARLLFISSLTRALADFLFPFSFRTFVGGGGNFDHAPALGRRFGPPCRCIRVSFSDRFRHYAYVVRGLAFGPDGVHVDLAAVSGRQPLLRCVQVFHLHLQQR